MRHKQLSLVLMRKYGRSFAAVILVAFLALTSHGISKISCPDDISAAPASFWAIDGGDPGRTGSANASCGPSATSLGQLWQGVNDKAFFSVISDSKTLYTVSRDPDIGGYYELRCYDYATGGYLWGQGPKAYISRPCLSGKMLYFISYDISYTSSLTCFDTVKRKPVWEFTIEDQVESDPLFVGGKVVFLYGQTILALDAATGKKKFSFELDYPPLSRLASNGNSVFAVVSDGSINSIDLSTGEQLWTANGILGEVSEKDRVALSVLQDAVFVSRSGGDSLIVALDSKNGDKKWEKKFEKTFLDSFVLWQGKIIANLFDEKGQVLYALSQTDGSKFYFTNIRNTAPKGDTQTNISPMSVFGDYLIMPTRSSVVCIMGALSGMERYRIKTQELPSIVIPTLGRIYAGSGNNIECFGQMPEGGLYISPTKLDFGEVPKYQAAQASFTIKNCLPEKVSVALSQGFDWATLSVKSAVIEPQKRLVINITTVPIKLASAGQKNGTIKISWSSRSVVVSVAAKVVDKPIDNNWLMPRYNEKKVGIPPKGTSPNKPHVSVIWSAQLPQTSGLSPFAPVVYKGKAYVAYGKTLAGFDMTNGKKVLSISLPFTAISSPAVSDSRLYVSGKSSSTDLYCLNCANGKTIWTAKGKGSQTSHVVYEGKLYGTFQGTIYCLNAYDGKQVWLKSFAGASFFSPSIGQGLVYCWFVDPNGKWSLSCFSAKNGSLVWSYDYVQKFSLSRPQNGEYFAPVVFKDMLYTVMPEREGSSVAIFDAKTGSLLRNFKFAGSSEADTKFPTFGSMPFMGSGKIIALSGEKPTIFGFDEETGAQVWRKNIAQKNDPLVPINPALTGSDFSQGYLVVGYAKSLQCINPANGKTIWTLPVGLGYCSSPAISSGKILVFGNDGKLICFGESPSAKKKLVFVLGQKSFKRDSFTYPTELGVVKLDGVLYAYAANIVEPLFGTASWLPKESKLTCRLGKNTVEFWLGNPKAKVNGKLVPIDANPKIVPKASQGIMHVPLAFLCKSLKAAMSFDSKTGTATISYP